MNLPEVLEECWNLHKHSERWIEASDAVRVEIEYRTVRGDAVRVEFKTERAALKALRLSIMAAAIRTLKTLIAAKGSEPCIQGGVTDAKRGRAVRGKTAGGDRKEHRG
jgi:hypothetical protein